MPKFKFTPLAPVASGNKILEFLDTQISCTFLDEIKNDGSMVYAANGDVLTVHPSLEMEYKPASKSAMTNSQISLRVNQWFSKCWIKTIK